MKQFPPIDLFSFIFGFVLALLIILAIWQIGKLRSKLKNVSVKQAELIKLSKRNACERDLRILLLRKCQRLHIASSLFPLNAIYVEQKLQSTIIISDPHQAYEDEPSIFKHHMQFNDFPELISGKPLPLLSLSEAMSGGKNIAVMNEIGSGKTTLLARFASDILENKCIQIEFNKFFPIYMHINELDYLTTSASALIGEISKALCYQNPQIDPGSVNDIISDYLSKKLLMLFIDGLDELRPEHFQQAVNLINSTIKLHPQLRIALGIGPSYSSNLFESNFSFLSLQTPDETFQKTLLKNWRGQFSQSVENSGLSNKQPEGLISSLWAIQESQNLLPYDLTVEIWNSLSPNSTATSNNTIVMVERLLHGQLTIHLIENIADFIAKNNFKGIQSTPLIRMLKDDRAKLATNKLSGVTVTSTPISASVDSVSTSEIELIDLLKLNIFCINKFGLISFTNPSTFANILPYSRLTELKTDWRYLLKSPMDALLCKLGDPDLEIAIKWVSLEDPILFRNILLSIRHLLNHRANSDKSQIVFRKIFTLIQNEEVPLSIRIKLFSAFLLSDNSSMRQIFKIFKESPSISMHQLAAFYFSKFHGKEDINILIDFLNENNQLLNTFSCFSLYSIWDKQSIEIIREILTNGNDTQRKIAAELLAFKVPEGHKLLEEYSQHEDILCRKAIIGGLRLVHENWSTSLIEKMNIEDNQWFVRDTAVHALENPYTNDLYIPRKLQEPWIASWLIKYASQTGTGVPEDVYPYDLFYNLLDSGTIEEQLCVLNYLAEKPDKRTVQNLINLTKIDNPLREEALSILTLFSHRDSDLASFT